MKMKFYNVLMVFLIVPVISMAQMANHAENGSMEESVVGEYGRGGNSDNPGWQFLWNNAQFEELQIPQPSVVDTEASDGEKSAMVFVQELPEEAAQNGQSHFAQNVGWTPDPAENPEAALEPNYYRVSLSIKPVETNQFFHIAIGNFSFEQRRRLHEIEAIADEWNHYSFVYFNALDDRARLSFHYNLEQNLASLPFTFYFDDFRYEQSSLVYANLLEDGSEIHAGLGWTAAPGAIDPAAFSFKNGDSEGQVASAEILEDSLTLKLVLNAVIASDEEVHISYDNSVAEVAYGDPNAPVGNIDSFTDEYVVNQSEATETPVNEVVASGQVSVFPNPVTNDVIQLKGIEQYQTVRIYSVTGEEVYSLQVNGEKQISVPFHEMSSGVYFLKAVAEDGATETVKFIK